MWRHFRIIRIAVFRTFRIINIFRILYIKMYQDLLKPLFLDVKTFVLDTLFPITCLTCSEEGSFICSDCQSLLKKLENQRCIVCQKPTPFGLTHPGCLTPHGADGLISFYDYHDPKVAQILIKGKYSFLPDVYKALGKILAKKLKVGYSVLLTPSTYLSCRQAGNLKPILVPIPLHHSRKRWRGFNQAEVLCQAIAKELNLENTDILKRQKITKTQKDLNKEERVKNIREAFTLSKDFQNSKFKILNSTVILVDDVTTTGATLQEAAKVLKRNGALRVICLTVARD